MGLLFADAGDTSASATCSNGRALLLAARICLNPLPESSVRRDTPPARAAGRLVGDLDTCPEVIAGCRRGRESRTTCSPTISRRTRHSGVESDHPYITAYEEEKIPWGEMRRSR